MISRAIPNVFVGNPSLYYIHCIEYNHMKLPHTFFFLD